MNILLTGGAGYIGSHTFLALSAAGFTPVILDDFSLGRKEFVADRIWYEGDIADPEIGDVAARMLRVAVLGDMLELGSAEQKAHEEVGCRAAMVADVLQETQVRVKKTQPKSAQAVRELGAPLVAFGGQMREKNRVLQSFLSQRMYQHERVANIMTRAQRVVRDLFEAYVADPKLLPANWREESFTDDKSRFARQVCDFIAGMTDRYALAQHKELFDLDPLFR